MRRTWLACVSFLALAGCAEPPPCDDPAADGTCPPEASVALGTICADTNSDALCTDDRAWAPLSIETTSPVELAVHMGPQGGFHVFLSLRVWGLDPGPPGTAKDDPANPVMIWTVKDGDVVLGTRILQVNLLEGPDGSYERVGVAVILEENLVQTPENIDGRVLDVEIEVTDSAGSTATDVATVVAVGVIG